MIRYLSIERLAVIEALEVEFAPGFNVLTGETGAGKSILVEAVGLLLGARASADLVRTGEDTAVIQGVLEDREGRELLFRREVTAQGRSRAFIDGALTTSAALKELGARLVDLHGQHEHQALLDPRSHLDLLDEYAGLMSPYRLDVARTFSSYRDLRVELNQAQADERTRADRLDLVSFQLAEIDQFAPVPGEDEDLAARRQVLGNLDKLVRLCSEAYTTLYDGEHAVLGTLGSVWRKVAELAELDTSFAPYLEAKDTVKAQLEDLAYFLRSYASTLEASPEHLQQVEDRLARLERLKRRFGPTLEDVIRHRQSLAQEREQLEMSSARTAELTRRLGSARQAYLHHARELSTRRRAAARTFVADLESGLADLAMERTRCDVRFQDNEAPEAAWADHGLDQAEFYVSPNPGEELRPLSRVASGGELSRVMLALKTLASTDEPGKTLFFDEVDVGIGGRVADVVGARLRRLGERYQVLSVTHLPQIAAYGTTHFQISKRVKSDRTVTTVERLERKGRVEEVARMIAGARVSSVARANAEELLDRAEARATNEYQAKGERRK